MHIENMVKINVKKKMWVEVWGAAIAELGVQIIKCAPVGAREAFKLRKHLGVFEYTEESLFY